MLHTETVSNETLELLRKLESCDALSDFSLVGGTALSLYIGHRQSIDLDLFSPHPFDVNALEELLIDFFSFSVDFKEKNTLKGSINGVKIDCISHQYAPLESSYIEDGIRLYSLPDITAMKLSAISGDGSRLKDFIDIAYLSTVYSFEEMLSFYSKKYPNSNVIIPCKAINYYCDIDFDADIVMLNGKFDWKKIKKRLEEMTKKESAVFSTAPL